MRIELATDVPRIISFISMTVDNYLRKHNIPQAAAHHGLISAIGIRFECAEVGSGLDLCFDTRHSFKLDGTWTHDRFDHLACPRWNTAAASSITSSVEIAAINGAIDRLGPMPDEEAWFANFGNLLVHTVHTEEAQLIISKLPRTHECVLAIFDIEGFFIWPEHIAFGG